MTMRETLRMTLAWLEGGAIGVIFFGGLWYTVRMALPSGRPAICFLGSLVLRMCITLAGFYFTAEGNLGRLLLCLLGFIMARFAVTRLTRPPVIEPIPATDPSHAP
jgi:F1F0 ATPase subunit 2